MKIITGKIIKTMMTIVVVIMIVVMIRMIMMMMMMITLFSFIFAGLEFRENFLGTFRESLISR